MSARASYCSSSAARLSKAHEPGVKLVVGAVAILFPGSPFPIELLPLRFQFSRFSRLGFQFKLGPILELLPLGLPSVAAPLKRFLAGFERGLLLGDARDGLIAFERLLVQSRLHFATFRFERLAGRLECLPVSRQPLLRGRQSAPLLIEKLDFRRRGLPLDVERLSLRIEGLPVALELMLFCGQCSAVGGQALGFQRRGLCLICQG